MVNQPDQDMRGMHTPAPPNEGQRWQRYPSPYPEPPINQAHSAVPHGFFDRQLQRWRKDPAYAVLSLAITLVVIASLLFVTLGVRTLVGGSNGAIWSSAQTEHPSPPTPASTVDDKPAFPTPVSGKGTNRSSQPGSRPTPSLQPTPNNPNDQGSLTVQIVNIPNVVNNRDRALVNVQTSEPNVDVRLQVTYDAAPFFFSGGGNTTDDNGNATLSWNVRVLSTRGNNVQATVIVVATDRNGQQATSQPASVVVIA